jgi:hypothetical protein
MWNSVVWRNGPDLFDVNPGDLTLEYNNIEGGAGGVGNINLDPQFINAPIHWDRTSSGGTSNTLEVSNPGIYAVGDVLELENDAVARSVTAVAGTTVTFSPALSSATPAGMLVANWGTGATNLTEDFYIHLTSGNIDMADDGRAKATDRDGNPRVDIPGIGIPGTLADMGAYERQ